MVDPIEVKTVSNSRVSVEKFSVALESVMKVSFLQCVSDRTATSEAHAIRKVLNVLVV